MSAAASEKKINYDNEALQDLTGAYIVSTTHHILTLLIDFHVSSTMFHGEKGK